LSSHAGPEEGLSVEVEDALVRRGIEDLFPIQQMVVPHALDGRDVLAQSPTGSGKTLAFGLGIVEMCEPNGRYTQALVLVPTRELAVQVVEEITDIAKARQLTIAAVYGGAALRPQAKAAGRADIVVATPGRLDDLLQQRLVDLSDVHMLVLDEADRMLDMGFQPQVEKILRHVPEDRQTMLFSATLEGPVMGLAQKYTHDAVSVSVAPTVERLDAIEHEFAASIHAEKLDQLLDVLDEVEGPVVVFVRTKRGADRLAKKLKREGINAGAIHGGMTQPGRLRELRAFSAGERDTLVATDVFSRGIDVDDISLVINFDPPEDADVYTHRVGRTARAGRTGQALTFVIEDQRADVQAIAESLGLLEQYEHAGLLTTRRPATKTRSGRGGGGGGAGGGGGGGQRNGGGGSRSAGGSRNGSGSARQGTGNRTHGSRPAGGTPGSGNSGSRRRRRGGSGGGSTGHNGARASAS
jgi:ATP-dependent RNA helicase RhlE